MLLSGYIIYVPISYKSCVLIEIISKMIETLFIVVDIFLSYVSYMASSNKTLNAWKIKPAVMWGSVMIAIYNSVTFLALIEKCLGPDVIKSGRTKVYLQHSEIVRFWGIFFSQFWRSQIINSWWHFLARSISSHK